MPNKKIRQAPFVINKLKFKKILLLSVSLILLFIAAFISFETFFAKSSDNNTSSGNCINTSLQAQKKLASLPEVKKYLDQLKKDKKESFFQIDALFGHENETRVDYAYVGEKTDNNSKLVFGKYIFLSGCNYKLEKEENHTKGYSPVKFTYVYKIAYKSFTDETKQCSGGQSKGDTIDFNKDGTPEYLYACQSGKSANMIDYYLYSTKDDVVTLLDQFKSTGPYQNIKDLNADGYPDITTTGILIDEGECAGNSCFAPISRKNKNKYLLLRSHELIWNPNINKFNNPAKGEIYYNKNGKKIIVNKFK